MQYQIVKMDYTQDQLAQSKIQALMIVYPTLEQLGYSAMMQTYTGEVIEYPPSEDGMRNIEIDSNTHQLWRGMISDIADGEIDVSPISLLADTADLVTQAFNHLIPLLGDDEQIHIVRTVNAYAVSIATRENPFIYSFNIEWWPAMWGGHRVTEFYSTGLKHFCFMTK